MDVFYKIKALHQLGVKIHLHCFEYGRGEQKELNKYCSSVTYYKRDQSKLKLLDKLPFVVSTRKNQVLLQNILSNNFPVLIEGLHNGWYVQKLKDDPRKVFLRTHNVEHDYYLGLAKVEKSVFKKRFFKSEARKLKQFEGVLQFTDGLLTISPNDTNYFGRKYHNAHYVPAFHSGEEVTSKKGKGSFALYHGNLSVGENHEAAMYLIQKVFAKIKYPLIIAGSNPQPELIKEVEKYLHIDLKSKISFTEMDALIADAHINILPTFQPTGIKLKMLSALYKGRFCLVNNFMIENTGLEELCSISNTPKELQQEINRLSQMGFTEEILQFRRGILNEKFNNLESAKIIIASLAKTDSP